MELTQEFSMKEMIENSNNVKKSRLTLLLRKMEKEVRQLFQNEINVNNWQKASLAALSGLDLGSTMLYRKVA